ncbi:MAG: hypothetical protein Q8R92_05520, partial [Deltaproteobacteria bacterium]|nr:hypothetical protein [Deltaproteobacteria bacterium]
MTAAELCAAITDRRQKALEARISPYPRNNPIASDLGPCGRETALAILHWKERPLFGADLKARFERGTTIEDLVVNELGALGFSVRVDRKPFEIKDKAGRVVLRGRLDGFVTHERQEYPFECKSLDPLVYRRIHTVEDFEAFTWAAKYPRQLQAYLYANNFEEGFFLLDDCMGHWKLLPVTLDLDATETILRQCEMAVDAVDRIRNGDPEESALPEYHRDPTVCRRCWAFGRLCAPPAEYHGLTLVEDGELEARLDRRAELEAPHREYEALDKMAKEAVKERDGLLVGGWLVQGKLV